MKRGPKPLPAELYRGSWYKFRVNPVERGLLEEVGTSTFWRYFCLNVASVLKFNGLDEDTKETKVEITLRTEEGKKRSYELIFTVKDEEVKKDTT